MVPSLAHIRPARVRDGEVVDDEEISGLPAKGHGDANVSLQHRGNPFVWYQRAIPEAHVARPGTIRCKRRGQSDACLMIETSWMVQQNLVEEDSAA